MLSADVIYRSNQIECLQVIFMTHIGGNIIAFDYFQNTFQLISFDPVMKIITESLEIFFFVYNLIRTVTKKTSQFCYSEIGTGSDINLAFNDWVECRVGNIALDRAGPDIGFPFEASGMMVGTMLAL